MSTTVSFISSNPSQMPDNTAAAMAAVNANDNFEWLNVAAYGDHGTWLNTAGGVPATSDGGLNAVLANPGPGHHYVFQQGRPQDGWAGNFTIGDSILCTERSTGKLSINLESPISAFGTQIQPKSYIGNFNATIKLYCDDTVSNSQSFKNSFLGISSSAGDGKALVIGASASRKNIMRIEFAVYDLNWKAITLGINKLLIRV
jgi:hypothetical protein